MPKTYLDFKESHAISMEVDMLEELYNDALCHCDDDTAMELADRIHELEAGLVYDAVEGLYYTQED